jgi:hypothetical protein
MEVENQEGRGQLSAAVLLIKMVYHYSMHEEKQNIYDNRSAQTHHL